MSEIKIDESWKKVLAPEFNAPYMHDLKAFLKNEIDHGKVIYPESNHIFEAFNVTSFDKVKVVIIGQDPYHGVNQAHGMCFSVRKGVKTPPSLVNIYKELHNDVGMEIPKHGYLMHWAEQGVLLLNAVLTVEQGKAGSHHGRGWEKFTDAVIEHINQEKEHVVFLLWITSSTWQMTMPDY